MQWYATILPRIHPFLPCRRILEIGPGFGRWTHYLKDWCQHLVIVDISEDCVKACKDRFSAYPHITAHLNDGSSLEMVENGSLNFVFSFDSLVHADDMTMSAYMSQLALKLSEEGVAFLHHSNLGNYSPENLKKKNISLHERAESMTAEKLMSYARDSGLSCISQELITWGTDKILIDCISIVAGPGFSPAVETVVVENFDFTDEINYVAKLSNIYGVRRFSRTSEHVNRDP
jgi:SAM-dependent methyltransferase